MRTTSRIKTEVILHGNPASPGIAIGTAYLYLKEIPRVEERILTDGFNEEIERVRRAIEKSSKELNKILAFARQKVGDAKAKIFEAQIMVLEDQVLIESLQKRIVNEKRNGEFVVSDEIGKYAKLMLAANDEYMHERAHDMEDLKNRIIRNMQQEKLISKLEGIHIVVAHTLTPADTMILSRNKVLGYVADLGGVTSHAALFARSLKIPAVVGLGDISRVVETGDHLILDGYGGTIVVHPTKERLQEFERKRQHFVQFEAQLTVLKDLPAETKDGRTIELSANIELPEELEYVVLQGSQGVGLYRTESLLIGRDDFPSEEEQYLEYKKVTDRIYPHRVIMRTYDIGGDKIAPETAEEANPFLGWRGIRICLDRPEFFMQQLRALLRASTRKNLAIMFPMISTLSEVHKALEYVELAKTELRGQNVKFDEGVQIGVMIEVPSAALNAGAIAALVDFLSIGSNDLTQYLLAVDRGNSLVTSLYQEFDPSVLITLKHVINSGHKHGKWVGICGELAGNPAATALLVGLGIDELSVVAGILPEIKKIIRSLRYTDMQTIARKALGMATGEEVETCLVGFLRNACPDIPLENNV
ncbi:MAG TPA: phosphoenolpyruvate--protein phosphotransferase [Bacteroidota bacterium]|jgi:phosphotransferase system enzyme I (PtsI)|nr:phosphoenolpyruvate--protein phosphotransferase [Bacteroidota bacterium]